MSAYLYIYAQCKGNLFVGQDFSIICLINVTVGSNVDAANKLRTQRRTMDEMRAIRKEEDNS